MIIGVCDYQIVFRNLCRIFIFSPLLHINVLEYTTTKINGQFEYSISLDCHLLLVRLHLVEASGLCAHNISISVVE